MASPALPPAARDLLAPRLGGAPEFVIVGTMPAANELAVEAALLGTRINTRPLGTDQAVREAVGVAEGLVIIYRHGVMVSFTARPPAPGLEQAIRAHVLEPVSLRETEVAELRVASTRTDQIGDAGEIRVADLAPERLLIVATVLSRSVLLARDEILVAQAFEQTRPVVHDLSAHGRVALPVKEVMRHVGDVLGARLRLTGIAQADERPDLLWDFPELDRLYNRLEAEYELNERAEALEHKFVTLGAFSEALLDIAQDKRAVRLEVAIIALIAFEIVLSLAGIAQTIV